MSPTLNRAFAVLGALGIAVAAPAAADEPGYYGFYGVADEYPVGTCIGPIDSVFFTTDGVVLCAVQDSN
ncbi:MAG: hypothetical protein ABWY20_10630 [Mycobacterium sp.]